MLFFFSKKCFVVRNQVRVMKRDGRVWSGNFLFFPHPKSVGIRVEGVTPGLHSRDIRVDLKSRKGQ